MGQVVQDVRDINESIENIYMKFKINKIKKDRERLVEMINEKIEVLQSNQHNNTKTLISILEYLKEREDENV